MLNIRTQGQGEDGEERFRAIIENARDIITLIDQDGTIIYNSPAFVRQLGYESWEVLGQPFTAFLHEQDRAASGQRFQRIMAGGAPEGESFEFRFRHKDGSWRIFEAVVSNLLKNEAVQAVVLNSRDVTAHRESEMELARYRAHLEELVEQRTRELKEALDIERAMIEQQMIFISMVSHEFRTPLTIIDGNAQIIQKRGAALEREALERRAGSIRAAAERLVRLIETILSAHVLESGRLVVTMAPCDLSAIVRESCADQMDIALHHEIQTEIARGFPQMLLDAKVMRQIMANLISNAVKYSPRGTVIRISLEQEARAAVIRVADQGIGIPENELPKIFTRYFRASTSGGTPGSGLGLSLVKQFVELHDGEVGIQSKVGIGTTVTVRLPIRDAGDRGKK